MYAYCANNPINSSDSSGQLVLIGLVIGVTAGIIALGVSVQAVINNKQLNIAQDMLVNAATNKTPSNNTKQNIALKLQVRQQ